MMAIRQAVAPPARAKWPAIGLLALCEVLALPLWFSVSAVIPALRAEFDLTDFQVSLYTSSVGVGYVPIFNKK